MERIPPNKVDSKTLRYYINAAFNLFARPKYVTQLGLMVVAANQLQGG